MRNAAVRDLHLRTSELVREAAEGSVIVVERRGKPVAERHPITREPAKKSAKRGLPDMKDLWRRFSAVAKDSGRFVEEDR